MKSIVPVLILEDVNETNNPIEIKICKKVLSFGKISKGLKIVTGKCKITNEIVILIVTLLLCFK